MTELSKLEKAEKASTLLMAWTLFVALIYWMFRTPE